jgi:hypothetical protein
MSVDFVGVIRRVTPQQVDVLDEDGNVYDLVVDARTRAVRDGQRIPLEQLQEGTPVQASFDQIAGVSHARELEVLSPDEARDLKLPGQAPSGQARPPVPASGQGAAGQQGVQTGELGNRERLSRQPAAMLSVPPGTQPVPAPQPRGPSAGQARQPDAQPGATRGGAATPAPSGTQR